MKTIESALREEMRKLERVKINAQKRLREAPEGHLRIASKRDGAEYYYKDESIKQKNGQKLLILF